MLLAYRQSSFEELPKLKVMLNCCFQVAEIELASMSGANNRLDSVREKPGWYRTLLSGMAQLLLVYAYHSRGSGGSGLALEELRCLSGYVLIIQLI